MRRLRAELSANDSAARFKSLGVDVFLGEARFVGRDAAEVEGKRLNFSRALVATGARPAAPPIPGLAETGFLTNETVFSLTELPRRLAVIGAGPIGCELAQAFRRFGSEVWLLEALDADSAARGSRRRRDCRARDRGRRRRAAHRMQSRERRAKRGRPRRAT